MAFFASRQRRTLGIDVIDDLRQDVRLALRTVRRSPAFTATVVITLGLGIGANTVMFDVVDRLMFRPLTHLRDPGSVHRIYWRRMNRGTHTTNTSTPYTRYLDLSRGTTSFSQLAAFAERSLAVGEGESARERRVAAVSASYFEFFDVRPSLGRFFGADEDLTPRGADVAVLSHAFWRAHFGGRDVLGETLLVGDVRASIIGVAPPGFDGVHDADPPAVYIPITTYAAAHGGSESSRDYFTAYSWGWMNTLARRRPGITVAQAEADASRAFQRSWEAERAQAPTMPPLEVARPHVVVGAVRLGAGPTPALEARTALWVTGVAAIVLVIACANVANLLLARAIRRRSEVVVRLALGVSRRRLLMQSITETLTLTMLGGVVALLIASWGGATIRRLLLPAGSAPVIDLVDWRTLLVTLGVVAIVGLLIGLVPLLSAGRIDLASALRSGARGGTTNRTPLRSALLIVQCALSVVLLVGAGLFVRSLAAVEAMPMGYDTDRVVLLNRVQRGPASVDHRALRLRLLERARAVPGVEAAAWVSSAPFVSTSSTNLFVAGIDSVARLGNFTYQVTTDEYFRAMGTRILRGRGLEPTDRGGTPLVAVVSASMADVLWPGQTAIGQCMRVRADTMPCTTVVGVAEDMVQRDVVGGQRYHYYLPIEQVPQTQGRGLVLRVRGEPAIEGERIRAALQREMPGASYLTVQLLRDIVRNEQRSWRLGATMFAAFGLLALVVAAIGLYAVIGYDVDQRRHELGVRVALGAQRRHLLSIIVGRGLRLTAAGVALGCVLALFASRWVQPLLFGQSATDPINYGLVAVVMIGVALAASTAPALRASRTDPNLALKAE